MKNTNGYVKLSIQAACCILVSFFAWTQETREKESLAPPSGYVIMFERMGGYAGIHDNIWVYPDGKAINDTGKTAKVSRDAVNEWLKKFSPFTVFRSSATIRRWRSAWIASSIRLQFIRRTEREALFDGILLKLIWAAQKRD